MPTVQEIIAAKRKAKAQAQLVGSTAPATAPASGATPTATVPVSGVTAQVAPVMGASQSGATLPTEAQWETKPLIIMDPTEQAKPKAEPTPSEEPQAPSRFATTLADKLRDMAQLQDWLDVEQSANSLSEILSVILTLPYCPDVFIDECIDHAACALESQKNQYLRDVLNGKKQSGKKNKNVPSITTTASIDALDIDDLFVMGA